MISRPRGVGRIPDEARPALNLGRAIDAALADMRGIAATIRAALSEQLAPVQTRAWADRLDRGADRLERAAREVSGKEKGHPGRSLEKVDREAG